MIARILRCDKCASTAGAQPAASGTMARHAAYRGTIRRVRLGRWHYEHSSRTRVVARDLCATCRTPERIEQVRRYLVEDATRLGYTFIPG